MTPFSPSRKVLLKDSNSKSSSRKWWLKVGAMFALLLGVGIGAAVELFVLAKSDEADSISAEFTRTVDDRVSLIQDGFNSYMSGLLQLAVGLYSHVENGHYPTFSDFAFQSQRYNRTYPGVVAIGLVLNITHDRRAGFEAFMGTQGQPNSRILEPSFLKTPAAERAAYLPAAYAVISPDLSPIYSDRIQNMDVLPIPGFGTAMLTDTSVGDCGINRVVSLVDNAHLFALFCAFRNESFATQTIPERIGNFTGGVAVFFTADSLVKSNVFRTAAAELLIEMDDTLESFGNISIPGLPLSVDESTRIVTASQSIVNGVHVVTAVSASEAAKAIAKAGRLVRSAYVTLANRVFRVTMAALPEFSDKRSTSNPSIVLGFSVGIVVVLVALFASLGFYQYKKDMAVAKADAERRQQTALVMNAAKDAHEKTIAYACHQLRNPLQSIVGSISFLKERFLKDDDCYEDISAIAGAASDMSRVIDDISDWVKVSVGQLELNLEAVTLKSLLEDVVEKHRQYVNPSFVTLGYAVSLSCRNLYFVLDPGRVKQVLTNAVMNSIRATESGSILLSVEPDDGVSPVVDSLCKLTFKVVDTGCGLGKLDPSKLFHQYFMTSAPSDGRDCDEVTESKSVLPVARRRPSKPLPTVQIGSGGNTHSFMTTSASTGNGGGDVGQVTGTPKSSTAPMATNDDWKSPSSSAKVAPMDSFSLSPHDLHEPPAEAPSLRPSVSVSRYTKSKQSPSLGSSKHSGAIEAASDEAEVAKLGIGIGLPMSKQIVDMMHGTISLTREANHTVFAFTIPTTCLLAPQPVALKSASSRMRGLAIVSETSSQRDKDRHSSSHEQRSKTSALNVVEEEPEFSRGGSVRASHSGTIPLVTPVLLGNESSVNRNAPGSAPNNVWNSSHNLDSRISAADVVVPLASSRQAHPLSPVSSSSVHRKLLTADTLGSSSPFDSIPTTLPDLREVTLSRDNSNTKPPREVKFSEAVSKHSASLSVSGSHASRSGGDEKIPTVLMSDAANRPIELPPQHNKLPAMALPPPVLLGSPADVSGMRVLVVDDERAIRRLCQRMLERLGCTCVLLEDGDQVMDALLSSGYVPKDGSALSLNVPGSSSTGAFQPFHAVLMDIMMVRSNGVDVVVDVLSRFGATPAATPASADRVGGGSSDSLSRPATTPNTPPPFIAMTANTSLADITNYKRAGFVNVLGKPFDLSALRTKLIACRPFA